MTWSVFFKNKVDSLANCDITISLSLWVIVLYLLGQTSVIFLGKSLLKSFTSVLLEDREFTGRIRNVSRRNNSGPLLTIMVRSGLYYHELLIFSFGISFVLRVSVNTKYTLGNVFVCGSIAFSCVQNVRWHNDDWDSPITGFGHVREKRSNKKNQATS